MLFRAEQISKTYRKGNTDIPILKGVDFTMEPGECVAITGPSGVGKSTLLHILGTLERPTSGRIYFGDIKQEIFRLSETALADFRNRALGFIFQFHHLLPEFSALENVMMPALIAGHGKRASEKEAREFLEFVGLSHRVDHRPSEMSGGEQQRVAIARSVILRPKLLLADEPTGNLDTQNSRNVIDLLLRLNREKQVSLLLVTHDRDIASRMQRTLRMRDGLFVDSTAPSP